ncbi:MAG: serine/threonine-protein kinase [Tahibacter sp.]
MAGSADFLTPGGALSGPVFSGLLKRLDRDLREFAAGERIGPYRIVRELGRGGMAVVYLAERADGEFDQTVALKLVRPGGNAAIAQELFRQERQLLAGLQHPHIARLLDGGRSPDGLLWFALEPVDGERIDRYCTAHALPVAARVELFAQVCGAVQFAHARLLVHRDIKPTNILVTAEGNATLLDFGIAQLLESVDRDAAVVDRALTPGYASPEQRRGERVGIGSDIYQLGLLLRAMLGVAEPAGGATKALTGPSLAATDATATDPDSPPVADAELAAVIALCLREDPQRRYASVAELLADLDAWRQIRPLRARAGGSAYRANRFLRRHRWSVLAAAFALTALIVLTVAFAVRLADQRDAAEREASRANAATRFLLDLFRVADPGVSRGDTLTANQILSSGADRLTTELKDQPGLRASLLEMVGQVHMGLGQSARAEPMLIEAVALSRNDARVDREILAQRVRVLAQIQWRLGHVDAALASAQEGLALIAARTDLPELQAKLLNTRGVAELMLGQPERTVETERVALALIEPRLGQGHELAGYAYNNLARAYSQLDREPEAAQTYAKALANIRHRLGETHPDYYDIGTTYARSLGRMGRYVEAYTGFASMRAGIAHTIGTQDWRYAYSLLAEADVRGWQGDAAGALPLAEQALATYRSSLGEEHILTAVGHEGLGNILHLLQRHTEALTAYRATLAIRSKTLAADHIDLAVAHFSVGRELCTLGQRVEALRELDAAAAIQRRRLPGAATPLHETEEERARCVAATK